MLGGGDLIGELAHWLAGIDRRCGSPSTAEQQRICALEQVFATTLARKALRAPAEPATGPGPPLSQQECQVHRLAKDQLNKIAQRRLAVIGSAKIRRDPRGWIQG